MPDLTPITREETLLDGGDLTPITRKEMFIKRIYDKTQAIPEPITREEYFLKKAGEGSGGDVTIEQLNVTQNGTYSESGKAYSPVIVNVSTPDNAYLLEDAEGLPSDIATFEASNLPMNKLKVGVEPIQDLHGYDHPWVGGAGKNKLQVTVTSQTIAGVTVTVKDDGTFIANGTATQNISLQLSRKSVNDTPLPEGQLIMTGCPSGGSTSSYYLTCWRTNGGNANDVGNGITFSYLSDWDFVVSLVITSGTVCNNLTFKPMIRLASESDATFAPYSNICPISGWNSVEVTVADDTTDPTTEETYEISLGQTVYGGKLNVTTGELTVDRAYVDLGDLNWTYRNGFFRTTDLNATIKKPANNNAKANVISSIYTVETWNAITNTDNGKLALSSGTADPMIVCNTDYTDATAFKTAMSGVQLCYELATPLTIQLTPTQVKSLLGSNNVWADTGKVLEAEFFTKGE